MKLGQGTQASVYGEKDHPVKRGQGERLFLLASQDFLEFRDTGAAVGAGIEALPNGLNSRQPLRFDRFPNTVFPHAKTGTDDLAAIWCPIERSSS